MATSSYGPLFGGDMKSYETTLTKKICISFWKMLHFYDWDISAILNEMKSWFWKMFNFLWLRY